MSCPELDKSSPWMASCLIPCLFFHLLCQPSLAVKEWSSGYNCLWNHRPYGSTSRCISFRIGPDKGIPLFLSWINQVYRALSKFSSAQGFIVCLPTLSVSLFAMNSLNLFLAAFMSETGFSNSKLSSSVYSFFTVF